MRVSSAIQLASMACIASAIVICAVVGCSRTHYRLQADSEAYDAISERNCDPRWFARRTSIDQDPRSRYFEVYDADRPPMPKDDPASHHYMHCVDGKKGWPHWHDNGQRSHLENPIWRQALAEYVEVDDGGAVKLDVDTALLLAYVHSPFHQQQLETLYLSALDVTAERFRLDTQFFGGYDTVYRHNGKLVPASLAFDPIVGHYVVTPPVEVAGLENNRLTVGRPSAANPALQMRRRFATAGELLAGFANSFVFEFTGGDANLSASLANFSFIQPLLRGAGRDVALAQLTFVERALLANLRTYGRFRRGFYSLVAIGDLGVESTQRNGATTSLTSFPGQGGLGGYLGLLQQLQQVRNSEDNLNLQLRTLARLEAFLAVGQIDLVQVEQFRQSVENERANLLLAQNFYELSLDRYKTDTLGLPPDLPTDLDDSFIEQFQLIPREATAVQDATVDLQARVGLLADDVPAEAMQQVFDEADELLLSMEQQVDSIQRDLARMDEAIPARLPHMTPDRQQSLQRDRQQLAETVADLLQKLKTAANLLRQIQQAHSPATQAATTRQLVVWLSNLVPIAERAVLARARARLEAVSVEPVQLDPRDAFGIALANRLDFMNGRAALVDSWRLIQFNADALQSVLDVTADGDIRTARNNPLSFRAPTGSMRLGLELDAPFTRLLERNAYRESIINYQQNRRALIQSRDSLNLGVRALLRQLEQLRTNLEIQRRSVAIAIRRVDLTQSEIRAPQAPPIPGQPANQFGPTAAFNLLDALSSLRDTQNSFLRVWLDYYATRMRLARELGTMQIDQQGRWIEQANSETNASPQVDGERLEELPPPVPVNWFELADESVEPRNGLVGGDGRIPIGSNLETKSGQRDTALIRIQRVSARPTPPVTNRYDMAIELY